MTTEINISSANNYQPAKPATQELSTDGDKVDKKEYSIYDIDKNGTVSISEQKAYIHIAANNDSKIKEAVSNGFIKGEVISKIANLQDIIVSSVEQANVEVKNIIDNSVNAVREAANNFIKSLTSSGEGWGTKHEHYDYIYEKLDQKGIPIDNIDDNKLADILARFDYDLDPDNNGIITKNEIQAYYGEQFMNKDENGNISDTKVLDWIVNKYIHKHNKADN